MWTAVSSILVLLVSVIDYLSGPDLTFSLFYFAVIALYSWKTSMLRHAVAGALGIAAVWVLVDRLTEAAPNLTILAWNGTMRLIVLVALAVIIRRLRRALEEERSLARADYLTGTLNARAFAERAELELARARRYRQPLTVAYVDVDDFKAINDRYGHCHGDEVLRSVAASLKATLRETDSISRLGGDEFIILLPDTNRDQAQAALQRVHGLLSASMAACEPSVTLSIGAVAFHEPPAGVETLKKASDVAMYEAKSSGKNCVSIHSFGAEPGFVRDVDAA